MLSIEHDAITLAPVEENGAYAASDSSHFETAPRYLQQPHQRPKQTVEGTLLILILTVIGIDI